MRKLIGILAIALLSVTSTVWASSKTTSKNSFSGYVEVTNKTGFDIHYLYVSPESADDWEEDVLGSDILYDEESIRVDLEGYSSSIFDIRAKDEDGDTYTFMGIDVAQQDLTITLADLDTSTDEEPAYIERTISGKKGSFDGYVEVENNTGFDIYTLQVSHSDLDDWGDDVLGGSTILYVGDTIRVNVENFPSARFDIRATDVDSDTYTRLNVDISVDDVNLTLSDLD